MVGEKMNRNKLITVVAYFNICIIWGSSNLATKIGVSAISPLQFACLRFGAAGIILAGIAIAKRDWKPFQAGELKILFTIGILMNFLTNGCVVISNTMIDSGVVTMMLAMIPIFTTLIEFFGKKKTRMGKKTVGGLIGGFAGIGIVVLGGGNSVKADLAGVVIILVGAYFWAFGSIYSKDKVISGTIFRHTAVEALFSSILFFITSSLLGQFRFQDITLNNLYPILYLAVFDSVIGFVSYIYLLKVLPAAKVCTYAYINPVVALILGFLFLGEPLSPGKILGMVVIIVSVIYIQKDSMSE